MALCPLLLRVVVHGIVPMVSTRFKACPCLALCFTTLCHASYLLTMLPHWCNPMSNHGLLWHFTHGILVHLHKGIVFLCYLCMPWWCPWVCHVALWYQLGHPSCKHLWILLIGLNVLAWYWTISNIRLKVKKLYNIMKIIKKKGEKKSDTELVEQFHEKEGLMC